MSGSLLLLCIRRWWSPPVGINVQDEDGNVVGVSKLAGKKALQQVAITRVVLPAPIILLPGLIMKVIKCSVKLTVCCSLLGSN